MSKVDCRSTPRHHHHHLHSGVGRCSSGPIWSASRAQSDAVQSCEIRIEGHQRNPLQPDGGIGAALKPRGEPSRAEQRALSPKSLIQTTELDKIQPAEKPQSKCSRQNEVKPALALKTLRISGEKKEYKIHGSLLTQCVWDYFLWLFQCFFAHICWINCIFFVSQFSVLLDGVLSLKGMLDQVCRQQGEVIRVH